MKIINSATPYYKTWIQLLVKSLSKLFENAQMQILWKGFKTHSDWLLICIFAVFFKLKFSNLADCCLSAACSPFLVSLNEMKGKNDEGPGSCPRYTWSPNQTWPALTSISRCASRGFWTSHAQNWRLLNFFQCTWNCTLLIRKHQ